MNRKQRLHTLVAVIGIALAAAQDARATFHLMQIEQVVGGVCGDTTSQAIQLRTRAAGQNFVGGISRLVAYDDAGANPVILIDFPSNVMNGLTGDRILVTSAAFAADHPAPASDFTLTHLIPASYLAAGRLTFEDTAIGSVYWSISWGGAAYTGSNTGRLDNEDDGDFGPSFRGELPATGQGLLFLGSATNKSTTNAVDYAVTPDEAIVTNNSRISGAVMDCFIFANGFESGNTTSWSAASP